jgi:hypothetical protein
MIKLEDVRCDTHQLPLHKGTSRSDDIRHDAPAPVRLGEPVTNFGPVIVRSRIRRSVRRVREWRSGSGVASPGGGFGVDADKLVGIRFAIGERDAERVVVDVLVVKKPDQAGLSLARSGDRRMTALTSIICSLRAAFIVRCQ